MQTRIPWRQKLERSAEAKIVAVPVKWRKRFGQGTMVIPPGVEVEALMREVPKGHLITQSALRERLARDHDVDHACPLVTGILVRIAAEAAEEDARSGRKQVTPWWRVVRDDGQLLEKCPGGQEEQKRRLEAEGHSVDTTRKRYKVIGLLK
jgi:hypothetical protein